MLSIGSWSMSTTSSSAAPRAGRVTKAPPVHLAVVLTRQRGQVAGRGHRDENQDGSRIDRALISMGFIDEEEIRIEEHQQRAEAGAQHQRRDEGLVRQLHQEQRAERTEHEHAAEGEADHGQRVGQRSRAAVDREVLLDAVSKLVELPDLRNDDVPEQLVEILKKTSEVLAKRPARTGALRHDSRLCGRFADVEPQGRAD